MQKQILDFDTIIALRPTDLFLISHAGKTCNVALNTVVAYTNAQILPFVSYLNGLVSTLSALEHIDTVYMSSNILALSADKDIFNSKVNQISADVSALSAGLISSKDYDIKVSANVIALSSSVNLLSATVDQIVANTPGILANFSVWSAGIDGRISSIEASVSSVSSFCLDLSAGFVSLGSSFSAISAQTDYLSASFGTINLEPIKTNINTLSSLSLYLSGSIDSLYVSISSYIGTLSAALTGVETSFNSLLSGLSSNFYTNLSSISSLLDDRLISFGVFSQTLSSYSDSLSANTVSLSGLIRGIETNFATNTSLSGLSAQLPPLSAFAYKLSSYADSLSAYVVNLSAVSDQFTIGNYQLSGMFLYLSAGVDAFYQTASGIITGDVQFDGHTIKSFDTITIKPSSQFIVNTFNQTGSQSHEWVFDQDGLLKMAGGVRYATNMEDGGPYNSPEILDLSKPVQKLNSGVYRLLDGVEGQIMYFVPKSNTAGHLSVEVHINNARYWVIDSLGRKFAVSSQFYWTPWVLDNHRLDPVYDIFPSIATAIFTDGAWNISTGGRNW